MNIKTAQVWHDYMSAKRARASQLAALADKIYKASEPMSDDEFEALLRASNAKYAPVETCPRVKREPIHVPGLIP